MIDECFMFYVEALRKIISGQNRTLAQGYIVHAHPPDHRLKFIFTSINLSNVLDRVFFDMVEINPNIGADGRELMAANMGRATFVLLAGSRRLVDRLRDRTSGVYYENGLIEANLRDRADFRVLGLLFDECPAAQAFPPTVNIDRMYGIFSPNIRGLHFQLEVARLLQSIASLRDPDSRVAYGQVYAAYERDIRERLRKLNPWRLFEHGRMQPVRYHGNRDVLLCRAFLCWEASSWNVHIEGFSSEKACLEAFNRNKHLCKIVFSLSEEGAVFLESRKGPLSHGDNTIRRRAIPYLRDLYDGNSLQ